MLTETSLPAMQVTPKIIAGKCSAEVYLGKHIAAVISSGPYNRLFQIETAYGPVEHDYISLDQAISEALKLFGIPDPIDEPQMPNFSDAILAQTLLDIAQLREYVLASDAYIFGQIFSDLPACLAKSSGDQNIVCYDKRIATACRNIIEATWTHCNDGL